MALVLAVIFVLMNTIVATANENLKHPIHIRPPYHELSKKVISSTKKGSNLFGYSLAYQENLKKLVVGSPKETQTGSIYLCPVIDSGLKCQKVPCQIDLDPKQQYVRTLDYWLGATVNAGKDFLMACAPRFTEKEDPKATFSSTTGYCFYMKAATGTPISKLSPIRRISMDMRKKYNIKVNETTEKDQKDHPPREATFSNTTGYCFYMKAATGTPISKLSAIRKISMDMRKKYNIKVNETIEKYQKDHPPREATFSNTTGYCFYMKAATGTPISKLSAIRKISMDMRKKYNIKVNETIEKYQKDHPPRENLMDSFGWSSYVDKGNSMFVGGPAMSVGRTIRYNTEDFNEQAQLIDVDNKELMDKKVKFNFGYSMTTGYFDDDDKEDLAISTPYGTIGYGRVYFVLKYDSKENLKIEQHMSVESEDVGMLFGAAMCSILKHDGRSALLVGAPVFAPKGSATDSSSQFYDTGAVYVYVFKNSKPVLVRKLLGYQNGGYFGNSIVSVGDFDGDKLDEVAISAPYEEDGRGAVYIYSGSQLLEAAKNDQERLDGTKLDYWQRIAPEKGPEQYFGWSLAALKDADQNGCNELAIGAPGANNFTILHCIASVNVAFDVKFPDLNVAVTQLDATKSSFVFEPCLIVTYPVKPAPSTIETDIYFNITIDHPHVTMKDADSEGLISFRQSLKTWVNKEKFCRKLTIVLPKEADYDHEINFTISASLVQNPLSLPVFNPRLVLLNDTTVHDSMFTAPSIPGSILSFQIDTTLSDGYLIGSTDNETLTIMIKNDGNTAYGACVRTRLTGVTPSNFPVHYCSYSDCNLRCNQTTLQKGQNWTATITLNSKQLTSASEKIEIAAELWTSNCNKRLNATFSKVINLKVDNNITITRLSNPSLSVNVTEEALRSHQGLYINHMYSIISNGITTWENLRCEVTVPAHITKSVKVQKKDCELNVRERKAVCIISTVKKNVPVHININMYIRPEHSIANEIRKGETKIDTNITLTVREGDVRQEKITTTVKLWKAPTVPLWMIIVACFVGLVIIVILIWALHEWGFFKRAEKNKLQELKQDVKRQSMRRSVMLRQSTIEVVQNKSQQEDRQHLMGLPEECDKDLTMHEETSKNTDPTKVAFNAELQNALKKPVRRRVTTEADIH